MEDFDTFIDGVTEIMEKAIWQGPVSLPQYASASEVGVQLKSPMETQVTFEQGFQVAGIDTQELAASSPTPTEGSGAQLPGANSWEPGFVYGEDTRNYAVRQDAPVGTDMGDESDGDDIGQPHGDEQQMSIVGRIPTNQFDALGAGDILPAFNRLRDKFTGPTPSALGSVPGSGGPVPGMDAMAGLPLGDGSGIVGGEGYMGRDGNFGVGDGDNDQDDYNRYPAGPAFQPGLGNQQSQYTPNPVYGRRSM